MEFAYQAKTRAGQLTSGILQVGTLTEARQALRSQGLFPLSLVPAKESQTSFSHRPTGRRRRITRTDLLMVTSQLAIMSRTGVDLADSLKSVGSRCPNPTLGEILEEVYEDVSSGQTVSAALKKHPRVFDSTYIAAVTAGEASGELTTILNRLAGLLRNEVALRSSVRSTLAYPIVLTSVAGLAIGALVFFVLPQFTKVFTELEVPAPPVTQMLLDGASFLRGHLLLFLLGGVALAALAYYIGLGHSAQRWKQWLTLHAVPFRGAGRSLLTGRLLKVLGALLQSGIPLLQSIQLCKGAVNNYLFHGLLEQLEQDVINGRGIGQRLDNTPFVPAGAAQMVITGERSGELGLVVESIGEFYEDDGQRQLKQVVKLLEPAIILAMGVVVACVVLAVIMPLLDVSTLAA